MIEVKKKEGESNESLLRRFNRKVQQSGVLLTVKKRQFQLKQKSKNIQRTEAVRRSKIRATKDYLRKIGKLEETRDPYGRVKSTSSKKVRVKR